MDIRMDCAICCTDTTIDGLDDGLQLEHALMALNSYHVHPADEIDKYRDSETRYITGGPPDTDEATDE